MSDNTNLHKAKRAKNDEFYTRYEDIENEVQHYAAELKGQWIYCPCDDYEWSNFVKYFKDNFSRYELKHLTATHIHLDGTPSERYDYDGVNETITMLNGNGDFRSEECSRIKDAADIVITNPPFSLFREFINWLKDDEHMKKFLIIGSIIAYAWKEIIRMLKFNKMDIGYLFHKNMSFTNPDSNEHQKLGNVGWYQSLKNNIDRTEMELTKHYNSVDYPKYDNYDAINIDKSKDIPVDYEGEMGVPISFIPFMNRQKFELIGVFNHYDKPDIDNGSICGMDTEYIDTAGKVKMWRGPTIDKKTKYIRLIIKNKHSVSTENNVNNSVDE